MRWFWKKQRGKTVAQLEDAAKRADAVWDAASREYIAAVGIDQVRARGAMIAVNSACYDYQVATEKLYAAKLKESKK
jgi:hypothetical protein